MAGTVMRHDVKRSAADVPARGKVVAPATLPAEEPSRAERARRSAYRGRFAILYVVLAGIAGAAIGTTIVLVGRGSPAPAPPWSDWQPVGSPERRAGQIGAHVTGTYRLPSGRQLTIVTYTGPPTVTGPEGTTFQVRSIAIQPDTSGGRAEADDISAVSAGGTVMYTLCGLGTSCSIREGQASNARSALLRREALELALYTFNYLDGVESVLVLLPPRPDGQAATAVFLERSDVRTELSRPLAQTFTSPLTPGIGEITEDERQTVDRITRTRLYGYGYLQAQDGSPVMVLSPRLELSLVPALLGVRLLEDDRRQAIRSGRRLGHARV